MLTRAGHALVSLTPRRVESVVHHAFAVGLTSQLMPYTPSPYPSLPSICVLYWGLCGLRLLRPEEFEPVLINGYKITIKAALDDNQGRTFWVSREHAEQLAVVLQVLCLPLVLQGPCLPLVEVTLCPHSLAAHEV